MTTSAQDGAGGAGAEPVLLRLSAACPGCGTRPALRVTPPLRAAASARPAEERLATYQCQRRGCGAVYSLVARHLRDAA